MKYLVIYHYMSQLLTGHGGFDAKLHAFRLKPNSMSECGEEETAEHVLLRCENHIVPRVPWLFEINEETATMEVLSIAIATRPGFNATQNMWKMCYESQRMVDCEVTRLYVLHLNIPSNNNNN